MFGKLYVIVIVLWLVLVDWVCLFGVDVVVDYFGDLLV